MKNSSMNYYWSRNVPTTKYFLIQRLAIWINDDKAMERLEKEILEIQGIDELKEKFERLLNKHQHRYGYYRCAALQKECLGYLSKDIDVQIPIEELIHLLEY